MNKQVLINSSEVDALKRHVTNQIKSEKGKEIENSTEARVALYSTEIQKYLNSDNSFLQFSKQDTIFANSGKTKYLPQSVANPSVTKGKFNAETKANGDASNVGTVTVRRNTNKSYTIEYFGTAPQVINLPEDTELSYNARQDLLDAHAAAIMNTICNYALIEWSPTDNSNGYLVLSTGSDRLSEVDSTTTVKAITKNDVVNAVAVLRSQNLPKGSNLYALPTPQQYADLTKELDIDYVKGGNSKMLEQGILGKIAGVNILDPRQNDDWNANVLYDTETAPGTFTKQALGATADGTTDASCMIIWSDKTVYRAQGTPKVYSSLNDPLYKGDVFATEVRFGATKARSDEKGVVCIVEDIQAGGAS